MKPITVVHIGSTKFYETFELMNRLDTLDHKIVLTVGCVTQSDDALFAGLPPEEARKIKACLDALHLYKIDRAGEVLVLNKQWYLGPSTLHELCYAYNQGKPIRWLEEWTMYCPACRCEGPEAEHFFHTLLSANELGYLIEDEETHPYLLGQLVDWYGLIAPVVQLVDGTLALHIDVWCTRCHREHETCYAVADPCDGLFCITVDEQGNLLADLRHEEGFVCAECTKSNRQPAPEYHRVLRHLTLRRADAPDENRLGRRIAAGSASPLGDDRRRRF